MHTMQRRKLEAAPQELLSDLQSEARKRFNLDYSGLAARVRDALACMEMKACTAFTRSTANDVEDTEEVK